MFGTSRNKILILSVLAGGIAVFVSLYFTISKFQLRFKDRSSAGSILAHMLKSRIKGFKHENGEIIVFGITRGGVVTAQTIAAKLSAGLGVILVAKIGEPDNKEKAIGAITEDGTYYLNEKRINELQISRQYVEKEKLEQQEKIVQRKTLYRDIGSMTTRNFDLNRRTVILVDDGASTGASMIASARSIRKKGPGHLIIAVPVAPTHAVKLLKAEADVVEVISYASSSDFATVGQFYEHFEPVTDEQVIGIMSHTNLES